MSDLVRFLRFPELKARCGIPYSRRYIDGLEKLGRFPKRVQLGANSVAWVEGEVVAWQEAKIAARGTVAEPLGDQAPAEGSANPLVVH